MMSETDHQRWARRIAELHTELDWHEDQLRDANTDTDYDNAAVARDHVLAELDHATDNLRRLTT